MPIYSIRQLLIRFWGCLRLRRRRQFSLLLALIILSSFAEVFSIGAVIPFLGALTAPSKVFEHPLVHPLINALGLTTPDQILLPLTIIFGMAAIVAGSMRLLVLWASTRLSFATGGEISSDIYHRTLCQPYMVHVSRNSSEVINALTVKVSAAIGVVNMTITLISSVVIITTIMFALILINPVTAIECFAGFALIYFFIIKVTRKQLFIDSQCIARESTRVIQLLQEGLGGVRDILIDGTQESYSKIYTKANIPFYKAHGNVIFVSQSPRYAMEALGMLLISILAYTLTFQPNGLLKAIPILGAIAFGAQRLLPALQQAYAAWTAIHAGQVSLQDTLELLDQPLGVYENHSNINSLPFQHQISLKMLSFRYDFKTPYILEKINLNIVKGARVGFIGATGSGKSTLVDIVMGLLQPNEGLMEIDGQPLTSLNTRNWQKHIAHVPQTIYLSDSSIAENIAFGVPKEKIDYLRLCEAARQSHLSDLIETWPEKYETFVGERGVRLSGGQRQRIGIARALYKQADVIIFDEATSALDNETEQAVMQAIEGLSKDLTLIIIAHRLTTLKNCTQIVELGLGGIKRVGSYKDVVMQTVVETQINKES
jgi:ABC-type multidrug transport system fused ATPase/permease subunit